MSKTKRKRVPTTDATRLFEKTVVSMCREKNLQNRFTPAEIDMVIQPMVREFANTLEEFSEYIEAEDWDGLAALAAQEQTRRILRQSVRLRF